MSVLEAVAPEKSGGLVVDIKRGRTLRARITQMGDAWHLDIFSPDWTMHCTDVVEAYRQYREACKLAGVPIDSDDVLTIVEIYRPVPVTDGDRPEGYRRSRTPVAQVVQQMDNAWVLSVFDPHWSRPCRTVGEALDVFLKYAEPHPQRGPFGGR